MLKRRLPWIALGSAALVVAILLPLLSRPAKLPPFQLLNSWPHIKPAFRDRIDDLIPRRGSWGWAWRIEEFLFGKHKVVNISASMLTFKDGADAQCTAGMGPPAFSLTNQAEVWLFSTNELNAFRKIFKNCAGSEIVNGARASINDGMQAQVFSGESRGSPVLNAGFQMDLLAHTREAHDDLIVGVQYSEFQTNSDSKAVTGSVVVHTNFHTLFRVQLPSGKGLLIINKDSQPPKSNTFGIILNTFYPNVFNSAHSRLFAVDQFPLFSSLRSAEILKCSLTMAQK
jgi:hypothetical protein